MISVVTGDHMLFFKDLKPLSMVLLPRLSKLVSKGMRNHVRLDGDICAGFQLL